MAQTSCQFNNNLKTFKKKKRKNLNSMCLDEFVNGEQLLNYNPNINKNLI